MRLCTFELKTDFGAMERLGAATPKDNILDLNLAYALMLSERDNHPKAREVANVVVPPDMISWLENGTLGHKAASEALAYLSGRIDDIDLRGRKGERLVYARTEIRLLAPVPRPPMVRECGGFIGHVRQYVEQEKDANPQIKELLGFIEVNPLYHKPSATTVRGTDVDVLWPTYADVLDYELSIAAVIGRKGKDIPMEEAYDYIAGYTIFNDVSARDYQVLEMKTGLGAGQGKDWDGSNLFGPFMVTRDEFDPNKDHLMVVRVNGEEWGRGLSSNMDHKFNKMVNFVSQNLTIYPGELIASGTHPGLSGGDLHRAIRPGDVVELEVEGIGILRNRYVKPERKRVRWPAIAALRPQTLSTAPGRKMELLNIAKDVYACVQEDRGTPAYNNSMFVNLGGGLVVDTFCDLDRTQRMIDLYRAKGNWPPRYLVNTHADADHVWGNELFPDTEIIGHRLCAETMKKEAYGPQNAVLMSMNPPPEMEDFVKLFKEFDIGEIKVTPPTRLIEDRLDLELDGSPCEIIYVGPGHSGGDLIVHLPKQKVLHAGDLVFNGLTPVYWAVHYENIIKAYKLMESLNPAVVVPGHGPLCGGEQIKKCRAYFELVHTQARRFFDQGLSVLEASKRIELGEFAGWGWPHILCINVHGFFREFSGKAWDEESKEKAMKDLTRDSMKLKEFLKK